MDCRLGCRIVKVRSWDSGFKRWNIPVSISYDYEKPINLYWQKSFGVLTRIDWEYDKNWATDGIKKAENNNKYKSFSFDGHYSITYYPNSRTSISGSFSQSLEWWYRYDDVGDFYKDLISYTNLDLQVTYYFSPQLQLNAQGGIIYNYQTESYQEAKRNGATKTYNKYPLPSFSVSLHYQIF